MAGAGVAVVATLAPAVAEAVTFTGPTNFAAAGRPSAVASADFNADGDPDLAVANSITQDVSVLLGEAGGSFGAQTRFAAGGDAVSLAIGNLNTDVDTDPDLVVATSNGIAVLLGEAGGSFATRTTFASSGQPRSVAIGDFNADSDPDLAVVNGDLSNISILLGGPGGSFGAPTDFEAGSRLQSVAVGNFDADGDPDLAVALGGRDLAGGDPIMGQVAVLRGGAGGTFEDPVTHDIGNDTLPVFVTTGDFNADNDPDLAVAQFEANSISVLLGEAGTDFGAPEHLDAGGGNNFPRSIAIADFNADSDPDLATALQGSGAMSVRLGGAGGTFGPASRPVLGTNSPISIVAGDFDADADPDVALANFGDNNVSVLLSAPDTPTLTGVVPGSPANENSPELTGSVEPGTTVRLYETSDCSGAPVGEGSAGEFASPGITVPVQNDSSTTFRATASFPAGGASACSTSSITYVEDSTAPDAPQLVATEPGPPANDNNPRATGDAEADSTVTLYESNDCTGAIEVQGTAAELASPGLAAAVGDDQVVAFTATATDAAGNASACSSPISYTEDSTAPAAPELVGSDPSSPANDNTPEVMGTAEPGSTVNVYTSVDCSGQPVATGPAADFASPGLGVAFPDDSTTDVWATATDAAGNVSQCSPSPLTYVEVTTPPVAALVRWPHPAHTGDTVNFDASQSSGLALARYEWDLDGDGTFETDTGGIPAASRSYDSVGEISVAVRVTNQLGQAGATSAPLSIRLRPPPGAVGVSINGGAQFTKDPNAQVTLTSVWPAHAQSMRVSNDGGFANPGVFPVAAETTWVLDASGPERLPKTVYVRFDDQTQTFTDDIILDQTPPQILGATATEGGAGSGQASVGQAIADANLAAARRIRYRLQIRARDRTSGVRQMQVTNRKRRPGRLRRFARRTTYRSASPRIFVRVRDGAGNFSRWRKVRHR